MKVQITPTKIYDKKGRAVTYSGGDVYLDLANGQIHKEGTVAAIYDVTTGSKWVTDFAWTGVAAIMTAAVPSGGYHLLT